MAKSLFEELGGKYERQGDYLIPCLTVPAEEEQAIGIWGQRHLDYLKQYRKVTYTNLLTSGRLNAYLADINRQAQERFERLIEGMKQAQGITEQLKAENALEWTGCLNNIRACAREIVEKEIIAAAKASHAHSFIRRLPKGYDTEIGEDGGSLSQGQKQLLCITRVMLCLPPMLILDEATSSIDTRTEIKIQKAFLTMMQGRTSFIVAHRLSTIREADIILVMKDGKIIEQGNHESLLAADGFYANLYNSQFA